MKQKINWIIFKETWGSEEDIAIVDLGELGLSERTKNRINWLYISQEIVFQSVQSEFLLN